MYRLKRKRRLVEVFKLEVDVFLTENTNRTVTKGKTLIKVNKVFVH